jgi:quinol monooxygenase YgiN
MLIFYPLQKGIPMISIVVKFNVRPEYGDEWLDRISDFTQATRQEPGNLWFEWSRCVDNPNRFVLIEGFRDADAGAEHVNSEHFKEAIKQAPAMLLNTPEVLYAEIPGTEWSPLAEMSVPDNGSA